MEIFDVRVLGYSDLTSSYTVSYCVGVGQGVVRRTTCQYVDGELTRDNSNTELKDIITKEVQAYNRKHGLCVCTLFHREDSYPCAIMDQYLTDVCQEKNIVLCVLDMANKEFISITAKAPIDRLPGVTFTLDNRVVSGASGMLTKKERRALVEKYKK